MQPRLKRDRLKPSTHSVSHFPDHTSVTKSGQSLENGHDEMRPQGSEEWLGEATTGPFLEVKEPAISPVEFKSNNASSKRAKVGER